ncbi:MAG: ImmA/IrrE family metallo-endopeptidase [Firmicutes bacterium]|nr:ImmA/IrrE family metallo-endopeptidase [Bacillota bacterium]
MIGKNLKYYRLKNNMSMKDLADRSGISAMSISYYEKGDRRPSQTVLKNLAAALDIKVTDFLSRREETLVFEHGEFRKNSRLSNRQQEYIREEAEEYFGRYYQAAQLIGGNALPEIPEKHHLKFSDNTEECAKAVRSYLNMSECGPVGNLVELIENKGILLYFCYIDNDDFSGMNGTVNGRPYIIVNSKMSPERSRSNMAHELVHIIFDPEDIPEKELERRVAAISGAFLFPAIDAERELGVRRNQVTNDMVSVCREYGISMYMLVMRANILNIINDTAAKTFYINANKAGWRKGEPHRISAEEPRLFNQLVYRAVCENMITVQKGAEILKVPYKDVLYNCTALDMRG